MRRAPPRCERRCGTFPPDPLPSDSGNGLCAVRRADHAAGPSAYAEARGLCMHCCASARRGVAQARRRAACGGRTSATAASYAARVLRHWRGVSLRRFGPIRRAAPSGVARGVYPKSFVMVWSAPPTSSATAALVQPLPAAQCSAVALPDGAGAVGPPPTDRRRTGRRGRRTHRCSWCSRRRARRRASRRSRDGRWPPQSSRRSLQTCSTAGHCGGGEPR